MKNILGLITGLLLLHLAQPLLASEAADVIFYNGSILTMNDNQPEVEAIAIKEGKIIAVGKKADILQKSGNATNKIDLSGKTMLPGFFDSHGHAWLVGFQSLTANLLPPPDGKGKDIESLITLLRDWAIANKGGIEKIGWIIGFGYDNSQLAEQQHPTRHDLDQVSKDIPILIVHQSGHLGVANSKALEIANISAKSEDPEGGVFQREQNSKEPNGVAEEYAFFQLAGAFAKSLNTNVNDLFVVEGTKMLASFGYTTGQEGRAISPALDAMKRVADSGALKIDLVAYPDILEVDNIEPTTNYSNRYRIGGVKLTIDGSPQGKTAWLTKPYFIPPPGRDENYAGYPAITKEQTVQAIQKSFAHNWQILCHANGDAAIDLFIKAVGVARKKYPEAANRPVLIHGQTLREDQVDQLKDLEIFPSLFPMHTFYWGDYHRDSVLGPERAANISPTGWLVDRGMKFGTHHDAPVALPDSMRVLSATVTRRTRTGEILGPQQRVSVDTALKAMTIWPAWQHFEEDKKGSIEVGKLADLVVLSENPMKVPETQLDKLKVLETFKEGKSVYKMQDNVGSLSGSAMFGLTVSDSVCIFHDHPEFKPVCGDGCFNHGLSVFVSAINATSVEDPGRDVHTPHKSETPKQ
jgi:predicted amidohydrolase YtcJ